MDKNKVKELLFKLKTLSHNNDNIFLEEIHFLFDELESEKYKVVVIGEFSAGKSTFINAILGKKILYSFMGEATRTVTYIEKGEDVGAYIHYLNEEKFVPLGNVDDYERLQSYLSKDNEDIKPKFVQITAPTFKFDGDIALIDTPGLQGLNIEDMSITRKAVESANATIFVITNSGFSQSELDILTGKNKEFGDINSKDILIIINKIGEVYENASQENPDEVVERIKQSVKNVLEENGLGNLPIFTVDSRDYLWSQDDNEYNVVKRVTENTSDIIFSQKHYKKRSRFSTVLDFLDNFLLASNVEINFIQDIYSKAKCIFEEFESLLKSSEIREAVEINKQLILLDKQKQLLFNNRKKLYNTITRSLSNTLENYIDSLDEENNKYYNSLNQLLAKRINDIFVAKDSFNTNLKYFDDVLQKELMTYKDKVQLNLNVFLLALRDYIINKPWAEIFNDVFNDFEKSNFKNKYKNIDFQVELKSLTNLDEDIELRKSKDDLENHQKILKHEKDKKKILESQLKYNNEQNFDKQFQILEDRHKSNLADLGLRPGPKQKYKDISEKKGFIFKKTVWKTVPDGLDYSPCEEWESKRKEIAQSHANDLEEFNKKRNTYDNLLNEYNRFNKKILVNEEMIAMIQEDISERKRIIKQNAETRTEEFLNEKRMQLLRLTRINIKDFLKDISSEVDHKTSQFKTTFMDDLEHEISAALENHKNQLDKKVESLKKGLIGHYDLYTNFENMIEEIRREYI